MKQALDIDEQIQKLRSYGMLFDNEEKAKEILLDVGFYRLGFYSFPFEISYPSLKNRTHMLREGTSFKSVFDLYEFDTRLRRILLNALDRIEVNVRTRITYIVSNYYKASPTWFADKNIMTAAYVEDFNNKIYSSISENDVIKRHHESHINDKYAPAWKTIEFMTLGNICRLYGSIKDIDVKKHVAKEYGCSLKVFSNYLETIRIIRNKCAHGNCVYSLSIAKGIQSKLAGVHEECRHNICGALAVIRYLLGRISKKRKEELENEIRKLMNNSRESKTDEIIKKWGQAEMAVHGFLEKC